MVPNHTRIFFFINFSEQLLNAPKHILYIVGNFLIDICSGTLVPEVPKVNPTGQIFSKIGSFLKSPSVDLMGKKIILHYIQNVFQAIWRYLRLQFFLTIPLVWNIFTFECSAPTVFLCMWSVSYRINHIVVLPQYVQVLGWSAERIQE